MKDTLGKLFIIIKYQNSMVFAYYICYNRHKSLVIFLNNYTQWRYYINKFKVFKDDGNFGGFGLESQAG